MSIWRDCLEKLMIGMGYDPDKLEAEASEFDKKHRGLFTARADRFLREYYPDVWNAFRAQMRLIEGIDPDKKFQGEK